MRNGMYDDDNSYPYKKSADNEDYESEEDAIYAKQYDELMDASEEYSASNSRRNAVIALSIVAAIIAVLLIVLFVMRSDDSGIDVPDEPVASSAHEIQDTESEALLKKGEHYISTGDYESAEDIYNQLLDITPDNDDVYTVHSILFNFNKAQAAFEDKKYSKARKFMEKISDDYVNYSGLNDDIDDLDDEIQNGEDACSALEDVADLIYGKNYDDALDAIELIDSDYLSDDDSRLLETYRSKAEKAVEKENTDDEDETSVNLSESKAETFIENYCKAFVDAINKEDFELVASYIHDTSPMYNQQKELIEYYWESGITEEFGSLTLNSVKKLGSGKWQISVTESETVYYPDGSSEYKTFEWNYTVEYIDSDFYLTKITEA